jgi:hypothetical protein
VEIGQFDWHHPRSEQLWARSAIHCALNRLQAVDLTFRLTIAPGQVDGVADSFDITAKNAGKTGQGGESGMNGIIDPSSSFVETRLRNMPRNRMEKLRKTANVGDPCLRASTFCA